MAKAPKRIVPVRIEEPDAAQAEAFGDGSGAPSDDLEWIRQPVTGPDPDAAPGRRMYVDIFKTRIVDYRQVRGRVATTFMVHHHHR